MDTRMILSEISRLNMITNRSVGIGKDELALSELGITHSFTENPLYKTGTKMTEELENIYASTLNLLISNVSDQSVCKLLLDIAIVRNLLLIEPQLLNEEIIAVASNLCRNELCIYFLGVDMFTELYQLMELVFNTSLTGLFSLQGADATTSTGRVHIIDVVAFKTERPVKQFKHKDYSSVDHPIPKEITNWEYLYVYAKFKEYLKNEENDILKSTAVNSICNFMLNYPEMDIRPFYMGYAEVSGKELIDLEKPRKIEEITEEGETIAQLKDEIIFNQLLDFPLHDLFYAKSTALLGSFEWEEAWEKSLKYFRFRGERVKCLIAMQKKDELERELLDWVFFMFHGYGIQYGTLINKTSAEVAIFISQLDLNNENTVQMAENKLITVRPWSSGDKMRLSGLLIKLGHLHQCVDFYDLAYNVHADFRPLSAKSLFYFQSKNFEQCAKTRGVKKDGKYF